MKRHLVSLEDIFASENSAILLIEEDEMTKEITVGMLQYLGYTVEAVGRGEEAVALYKFRKEEGNPFKAIIFGIWHAKGLDGKETLQQLLDYDPEVKAIVSSGITCNKTMADREVNGFHAPLPKSYGIRQLGSVLRAVIGSGPEKEKLTNIRRDVRHGIAAHFQFVDETGNVYEGITIDISKHGFGFLTEAVFAEGQIITVIDHELRNIVECKARVMWVKKSRQYYRAGAKILTSRR
jgi:CheY-like chemotaxis protein